MEEQTGWSAERHRTRGRGSRYPRQLLPPQAPKMIEWLSRHPRWTFHFTPTSASWLNAVEGFFTVSSSSVASNEAPSRASSISRPPAINHLAADHNQQPKTFGWIADSDKIIAAASCGRQVLDSIRQPSARSLWQSDQSPRGMFTVPAGDQRGVRPKRS